MLGSPTLATDLAEAERRQSGGSRDGGTRMQQHPKSLFFPTDKVINRTGLLFEMESPKSKEWHRDRINELKEDRSSAITTLSLLITSFLAICGIAYSVYFHFKNEIITIVFLILAMLWIGYRFWKEMKKTANVIRNKRKQIRHNFDILLGREK
jgi:cation transport ATPase